MNKDMIQVRDGEDVITITYEDLLKYHGNHMMGGVALAFKLMSMTFPLLCDEIPQRGHFNFYSGLGINGQGIMDAVEMVMRVKTSNQLRLDIAHCENQLGQLAPGGGRYYFEIGYKDKMIRAYLNEGIIPEAFIHFSKIAHKCKAEQVPMDKTDQDKLLELRKALARDIMSSKPQDLFVLMD